MKNIPIKYLATLALSLLLVPLAATADGQAKSQAEVQSMIAQAESSLQSARNVGYEWTTTAGLIKAAKKALQANDLEKGYTLAAKADAQGKASFQQRVASEQFWTFNLPRNLLR